jgi:hypothetical protein
MNKSKESIYSKYLSELNEYEITLQDEMIEEFEHWKEQVKDTLDGSHKIRFNRMNFYEVELVNDDDDVPF